MLSLPIRDGVGRKLPVLFLRREAGTRSAGPNPLRTRGVPGPLQGPMMPYSQVGPTLLIATGLLFSAYGVDRIIRAYRIASFDAWMVTVLPAAGAVAIGALCVYSGILLNGGA
jgi:hypothetical protein